MNLLNIIKNLHLRINKRKMSVFNLSYQEQLIFINKFKEPTDYFERSFYQMKCQRKINGFLLSFFYDLLSLFAMMPFFIKFRYVNSAKKNEKVDAVCMINFEEKGLMPSELLGKYHDTLYVDSFSGVFRKDDTRFLFRLVRRYPFAPYFLFKTMCRIAIYSEIIERFSPQAILASAEYSFTSSILTQYTREKNVAHINIMHGEKIFNIRDSFFIFDQFYIWDIHYKDLFVGLKADLQQFVIYKPKALYFDISDPLQKPTVDFKYYLAHPTAKELNSIVNSMKCLQSRGYRIKIRPHPSLMEIDMLRRIIPNEHIELPSKVRIDESIADSKYVIGEYSTVLLQAYNIGKKVVIDDITYSNHYEELKSLSYIMISKQHEKLSQILMNCGDIL